MKTYLSGILVESQNFWKSAEELHNSKEHTVQWNFDLIDELVKEMPVISGSIKSNNA